VNEGKAVCRIEMLYPEKYRAMEMLILLKYNIALGLKRLGLKRKSY
jgi:hypothetical protein